MADASDLLYRALVKGQTLWLFVKTADEGDWDDAGRQLEGVGFAVIENFISSPIALTLQEQVARLYAHDSVSFEVGRVGGGKDGEAHTYAHAAVRGDRHAILSTDDKRVPLLSQLLDRCDALVQHIARRHVSELRAVDLRSKPMLAVYPGNGSRYITHVDNPDGNGRMLTCLFYLNACWSTHDGGQLRLWSADESQVAATISPLLGRLVLFFSDARCPHEVLPAYSDRFALSVWYHGPEERRRADSQPPHSLPAGAAVRASEGAHRAFIDSAAHALRNNAHARIPPRDRRVVLALEELHRSQVYKPYDRPCSAMDAGAALASGRSTFLRWVDSAIVEAELHSLLRKLLPRLADAPVGAATTASSTAAALSCTQLMLVGADCLASEASADDRERRLPERSSS